MAKFITSVLAVGLLLCVMPTMAFEKNKILTVYDTLTIFDAIGTPVADASYKMDAWPYMEFYNTSSEVKDAWIFYALDWETYQGDCYNKTADKNEEHDWIIINPFDQTLTSYLLSNITYGTTGVSIGQTRVQGASNVVGFIFKTDRSITAPHDYPEPSIISEDEEKEVDLYMKYAYNTNPETAAWFTATYSHLYEENCNVTSPLALIYFLYVILWCIMGMVYVQQLYMKVEAENRLIMQKWMMMLPWVKAIECGLNGGWYTMCPWDTVDHAGIQYMNMARVTTITISYCFFCTFLYLLAKGWTTVVIQLSRQQTSNLTLLMGGVYILYSVYFLVDSYGIVYIMINMGIALMYLSLVWSFYKNCAANSQIVDNFINELDQIDDEEQQDGIKTSLVIKRNMLKSFSIGATGFAATEFIKFGLFNLSENEFLMVRAETLLQSFDFVWFAIILWTCRPRKEWPAYFTLSVQDLGRERGQGEDAEPVVPFITSDITQGFLKDYFDTTGRAESFTSKDDVVIVNPTKYMIDPKELSANEKYESSFKANPYEIEADEQTSLLKQISDIDLFDILGKTFIGTQDETQIKDLEKKKKKEEERPSLLKRMFSRGSNASPVHEEEKDATNSSDSDSERTDPEP